MSVGYTGPYGNMMSYVLGIGGAAGMPSGSNNHNAFMLGLVAQYLTAAAGGMTRRGVAVYSNLSSVGGANFAVRLNVPGTTAAPARVGPVPALFSNRVGFNTAAINSPY